MSPDRSPEMPARSTGTRARTFTDVDDVVGVLSTWGSTYYDDRVTQLDHALQCAALARASGAPDALVAAALVHDIGHLLELERTAGVIGDLGIDRNHEDIGAEALAPLFDQDVTAPVALHVAAKRYLCAVEPGYAATLSEGSVRSLATQGGPMSAEEVRRFELLPAHRAAADLRRWDDAGKVEHRVVPTLDDFVDVLHRVARD
jgi:phosphonate degradation associated HDIG domain protein